MRRLIAPLAALALLSSCTPQPAFAKHRHHVAHAHTSVWARPAEWCGWFMRRLLGVANPQGNRALWWAHYGQPADGPAPGRIVVWSRGHGHGHVGIIVGGSPGHWLVKSGNDGNAVRTRYRTVSNAIAFREP